MGRRTREQRRNRDTNGPRSSPGAAFASGAAFESGAREPSGPHERLAAPEGRGTTLAGSVTAVAPAGPDTAARGAPHTAAPLEAGLLAAFFAAHGRDLPWRHPDTGSWGVLVSEVMLQQTPVQRVEPVYLDWMRRWPAPADLAAGSVGDAVRAWGRLGYPRRALRLHEAARALTQRHGGAVPDDLDALLALPGVGEYTARAVLAFAFGRRVPVVDTNVRRVLSRAVRGIDEHGPATALDRAELEALLPRGDRPAAGFSAALMELGALRCSVTAPACDRCPLQASCAWFAAGRPTGPPRQRPAQRWQGTDRQLRGAIMAALRESDKPLPEADLASAARPVHRGAAQWRRCLDSLLADGLAVRDLDGLIGLP